MPRSMRSKILRGEHEDLGGHATRIPEWWLWTVKPTGGNGDGRRTGGCALVMDDDQLSTCRMKMAAAAWGMN
jgi:hypothetical protein